VDGILEPLDRQWLPVKFQDITIWTVRFRPSPSNAKLVDLLHAHCLAIPQHLDQEAAWAIASNHEISLPQLKKPVDVFRS